MCTEFFFGKYETQESKMMMGEYKGVISVTIFSLCCLCYKKLILHTHFVLSECLSTCKGSCTLEFNFSYNSQKYSKNVISVTVLSVTDLIKSVTIFGSFLKKVIIMQK